jgi:nucleotide-binding universal stress UspA family protein
MDHDGNAMIAAEPGAQGTPFGYRRVMIATWDGRLPLALIDYATASIDPAAVFLMVAVVAPGQDGQSDADARARCQATNMLQAAQTLLAARGRNASTELLKLSHAHASSGWLLADTAARWGADVVLTSCAGPAHLARAAHCPVLMLPDESVALHRRVPAERIFVASDESDASRDALDEARRLAGRHAQLRIARVVFGGPAAVAAQSFEPVLLPAAGHGRSLAREIVDAALAWRADLLVLGTHAGESSGKWRFASLAEQVAEVAGLPLLLVPLGGTAWRSGELA